MLVVLAAELQDWVVATGQHSFSAEIWNVDKGCAREISAEQRVIQRGSEGIWMDSKRSGHCSGLVLGPWLLGDKWGTTMNLPGEVCKATTQFFPGVSAFQRLRFLTLFQKHASFLI